MLKILLNESLFAQETIPNNQEKTVSVYINESIM